MKNTFINILIILIGIFVGMLANSAVIAAGGQLLPMPEEVDPMNAQNWELSYFVFPFLAHALGTLVGAIFVTKFARGHQFILAQIIGVFFLLGGITMVFIIPAPVWFIVLDLGVAYIPMSLLGSRIALASN